MKGKKSVIFFVSGILVCAGLFIAIKRIQPSAYVSAIIAPHHDLVATQRDEMFSRIAPRTQGRPIILLSPNHYDSGSANIQTRSDNFTTQYGELKINEELFKIAADNGAVDTPITYEIEHGIKSLLPDISRYYPSSEVLPLIIKESASRQELEKLFNTLSDSCKSCLLVTSADFSHYQPYLLSEQHDVLSIRGLANLDGELLDSRAELEPMHLPWITAYWAKLHKTERFVLDQHTNSTEIMTDYFAEGTTHIMGWYEVGKKLNTNPEVSVTISPQINLTDYVNNDIYTETFDQLGNRVFWGSDAVISSVLANHNTKTSKKNILSVLEYLHFTHIYLKEKTSPIDKIFNSSNISELNNQNPLLISGNRQKLAIFSSLANHINGELFTHYQNDNIVIYANWSDISLQEQQTLSRNWIDMGADIVVGIGDSSIGKTELYNNRPIFYSLGSMISSNPKNNNSSLAIHVRFTEESIYILPMLIEQRKNKPVLLRSNEASEQIKNIMTDFNNYLVDERGGLLFSINR